MRVELTDFASNQRLSGLSVGDEVTLRGLVERIEVDLVKVVELDDVEPKLIPSRLRVTVRVTAVNDDPAVSAT